jgi:hypothetical protein
MSEIRYPRCKGCGEEIITPWDKKEKEYCDACELEVNY